MIPAAHNTNTHHQDRPSPFFGSPRKMAKVVEPPSTIHLPCAGTPSTIHLPCAGTPSTIFLPCAGTPSSYRVLCGHGIILLTRDCMHFFCIHTNTGNPDRIRYESAFFPDPQKHDFTVEKISNGTGAKRLSGFTIEKNLVLQAFPLVVRSQHARQGRL